MMLQPNALPELVSSQIPAELPRETHPEEEPVHQLDEPAPTPLDLA
ncbi:hypothetical protein [Altererythrobacter sp. MF3-039]